MSTRHLEHLFAPRTLAVVGRFTNAGHRDRLLLANLTHSRCEAAWAVDLDGGPPPADLAPGVRWAGSLGALTDEIDTLVAALPLAELPNLLTGDRGLRVRNLILPARRMTPADEAHEAAARAAALAAGVRLLGPGSYGVVVPSLGLNASLFDQAPANGSIALISQSGALISSILDRARKRGLGFSHVVSLGSLADIDFGDAIDYLAWERKVSCLALYIENLASVKKFLSACRAAALVRPIVAIKGGRSPLGRSLIAKHTGRVAGEDRVYDTAFRRAGVIRVDTVGELLGSAEALSRGALPRGDRLAVITNSGGIGVQVADRLCLRGARLAELSPDLGDRLARTVAPYSGTLNPVCIAGDADAARYLEAVHLCVASGELDTILVVTVLGGGLVPERLVEDLGRVAAGSAVDLVHIWLGDRAAHGSALRRLREKRHTVYSSIEEAVTAYSYALRYLDKRSGVVVVPPRFDRDLVFHGEAARGHVMELLGSETGPTQPRDALDLLGCYGIPVGSRGSPGARFELRVGLRTDVEFGPYLFLGVGGLASRLVHDEAVILPPLNRLLARRLVEKSGFARGMSLDTGEAEHLEEILVRLSQLAVDFPQLYDLEVNPLALRGGRFVAAGARAILWDRGIAAPDHLATAPYPNQYESTDVLRDGTPVLIRPIRPEDAPSHYDFVRSLSARTMYDRFFGFRREVSDEQMVRFTQIDYSREVAIVARAERDGAERTIGVARLVYDPHEGTHEFAVVVADRWQSSGIGSMLMGRLIAIARDRRLPALYGSVLTTNTRMLALAHRLGFVVTERDAETVVIRLDL